MPAVGQGGGVELGLAEVGRVHEHLADEDVEMRQVDRVHILPDHRFAVVGGNRRILFARLERQARQIAGNIDVAARRLGPCDLALGVRAFEVDTPAGPRGHGLGAQMGVLEIAVVEIQLTDAQIPAGERQWRSARAVVVPCRGLDLIAYHGEPAKPVGRLGLPADPDAVDVRRFEAVVVEYGLHPRRFPVVQPHGQIDAIVVVHIHTRRVAGNGQRQGRGVVGRLGERVRQFERHALKIAVEGDVGQPAVACDFEGDVDIRGAAGVALPGFRQIVGKCGAVLGQFEPRPADDTLAIVSDRLEVRI